MSEFEYAPLTGHSPIHLGEHQYTNAWIVIHPWISGEGCLPEGVRLRTGSLVRLHDFALSQINGSFEAPWFFGVLHEPLYDEPGYHIFSAKTHLYTITSSRYVVPRGDTQIAILMTLVDMNQRTCRMHHLSLGQRSEEGIRGFLPPLHPWEANREWRHPGQARIDEWRMGRDTGFERVWSWYNADQEMSRFVGV